MDEPRAAGLVQAVLRCYPGRWRRRHGDEAAELAALLIKDGTPAGWIAWSYLAGAAREWLTPRPGRRLRAAPCALLAAVCLLGVSAGLLASAGPARAASTNPAHAHCRAGSPQPVPGVTGAVGPAAGGHPGSRVWPVLLTPARLTPVLLTPARPGPSCGAGGGGGRWLRRPSSSW